MGYKLHWIYWNIIYCSLHYIE